MASLRRRRGVAVPGCSPWDRARFERCDDLLLGGLLRMPWRSGALPRRKRRARRRSRRGSCARQFAAVLLMAAEDAKAGIVERRHLALGGVLNPLQSDARVEFDRSSHGLVLPLERAPALAWRPSGQGRVSGPGETSVSGSTGRPLAAAAAHARLGLWS